VQGCKVESSEAVGILMVDPSPKLALEGWLVAVAPAVLPAKGFVVQNVDLHLGELVFECCKVQERGLILLPH
jgi:hypothetical protein